MVNGDVTVRQGLADFRIYMESRGRAEGTIYLYRKYLRRLVESQEKAKRPLVRQLDAAAMTRFMTTVDGMNGRNNALAAVRAFLRWCVHMKYITQRAMDDTIGERTHVKVQRKPKHYIDVSDFPVMLDIAEEIHPWDRAVMGLALYTLGRASELTYMRLRDIDRIKGRLSIWRSKRKRWTVTPVGPDIEDELDLWLPWYAGDQGYSSPAAMAAAHPDWYLLPRKAAIRVGGVYPAGGPVGIYPELRAYRLERTMKTCLDGLGADGAQGFSVRHLGEGMHCIRRSGARALLDHLEGVLGQERALLQVSAMLDHDDHKQTLLYIGKEIEKERLDDYLRNNRMYGGSAPRRRVAPATVVQMPQRDTVTRSAASGV